MWAYSLLSIPFVKYAVLAIVALSFGFYQGCNYSNDKWQAKLQEAENKQLIEVRKIESERLKEVQEVSSAYEVKTLQLKEKLIAVQHDFSRLRVPTRKACLPTIASPASPTNAADTIARTDNGLEQSEVNLDGIAAQVIELGNDLDKCYIKLGELQNYVKLISNGN